MTARSTGLQGHSYSKRTKHTGAVVEGRQWRAEDTACQLNVRREKDHRVTTFHFSSYSDVVSTVGPRGQNPEVLQSAYRSCLEKMLELELKTIVS